ncbi:hypothetical protein CcaverHIS002_0300960 [Cutaneotrichosporon cavernicola]|uniref:F-box domain-containing protein n=1 Tax=Cutaneotrichosporon cavernicola TaxID=279322 RepID=A0AA48L2Q5_9TREE|nr:uncharacterized protein CcaverHIS019_0300930 [Cutaneotrichosporon cavernicola]BEI82228.1 hypothetical protein CcaverHIS002_0300960 [Cutaneotrichosporon cavernicola]BEI90023.1 hypothetical protein CcaverHIS019_0300930 [Cutaneotrichosporon cavernicola]BEI97797.1 hypothetical protein CcaverHIS631_0300960 [Cutaneotrichosporon cavernicola]BEJ05574.1 hypothetical protein CcaverHIS641_0300960 [Cutaneotrichosporon cavernicola]
MSSIAFDELSYPGIIDHIFAYASRDALLIMRQVSRAWRDRADAHFVTRVTIAQRSVGGKSVVEMRGPLGVIPRQDWYETSVGDATRVLDLGCGGSAAALAGLCRLHKLDLLRDHGYVMRNRAPLPPARAYLMNRVGVDTFSSYWDHLVICLPYFQPTFVPLENVFGSHGSFPKSLAGAVQNVRGTVRRPSVLASSLTFGDNGRASHLAAPHPRVSALGAGQYTGFVIPLSRPSRSFHVPGAFTIILARPPPDFAPRPQGVAASRRAPRRADDYEGTFRNMSRRIAKIVADGGLVPITLVGFDGWFTFLPHNRVCSYDTLMDEIRRSLTDFLKSDEGVEERMSAIEYLSLDEYCERVGNERFVLETEFADTMGPGPEDDGEGRTTWTPSVGVAAQGPQSLPA